MNTHMNATGGMASPPSKGHAAAASAADQSYRLPLSDALRLHLLLIDPAGVSHPAADSLQQSASSGAGRLKYRINCMSLSSFLLIESFSVDVSACTGTESPVQLCLYHKPIEAFLRALTSLAVATIPELALQMWFENISINSPAHVHRSLRRVLLVKWPCLIRPAACFT